MKNFSFSTIINSLLLKKLVTIFLMVSLCLNVVIPKSEQLKGSFVAAISCAVEVQTNFLDKYAVSVVNVTNGIASNILVALNKAGLSGENINKADKTTNNKDEQKTEPINTSTDSCIITENISSNTNTINLLKTKMTGLAYTNSANERNLYFSTEVVYANSATETGILFFILFAILVVRIKDTIAVLYNNKNIGISRLG